MAVPVLQRDLEEHLLTMHLAADALLLGRITYDGMAQAGPLWVATRSPTTSTP